MTSPDWDLIQACRQGDEKAWQQIVKKYKRLVFSIPLNYGLGQNDASDITQLTFMMLIQSLDTLRKEGHLGGWLATVARRNTWHVIKRHRRENLVSETPGDEIIVIDENREAEKERWELINWLQDGLSQLDEGCRELLAALYLDRVQPTYAEVAARFGLAVGSIGPMRARCLQRLKEIMRQREA